MDYKELQERLLGEEAINAIAILNDLSEDEFPKIYKDGIRITEGLYVHLTGNVLDGLDFMEKLGSIEEKLKISNQKLSISPNSWDCRMLILTLKEEST